MLVFITLSLRYSSSFILCFQSWNVWSPAEAQTSSTGGSMTWVLMCEWGAGESVAQWDCASWQPRRGVRLCTAQSHLCTWITRPNSYFWKERTAQSMKPLATSLQVLWGYFYISKTSPFAYYIHFSRLCINTLMNSH